MICGDEERECNFKINMEANIWRTNSIAEIFMTKELTNCNVIINVYSFIKKCFIKLNISKLGFIIVHFLNIRELT